MTLIRQVKIQSGSSGNLADVDASKQLKIIQENIVDVANSTSTPLGISGVFTGVWTDTLNYGTLLVGVFSDETSVDDGLEIQWSADGSTVLKIDPFAITADIGKQLTFSPKARYVRIKYTNGLIAQTSFTLQPVLKKSGFKASSHRIQDDIFADDDATLTKAVLTGKTPAGKFTNINTSPFGNLLVSLDEQKDAFGRLKTAEPFSIFDNSLTIGISDDLFWAELLNGTATSAYSRSESKKTLTTVAPGDYVVRQTKQRFKYQPAKSHEFFMTGMWSTEVGQRKRGGLVDYDDVGLVTITNAPQNGVFFENNAGILSWNIVNNGVITETATQANWNLDIADGTGKTGFELDIDATNILTGQLEWLGVGVVLVGFVTPEGTVDYVHAFKHASVSGFTEIYMRTANLGIAYEITSTSGGGSMSAMCSSVVSGGGFNPNGIPNGVQNSTDINCSKDVTELLIGIRLAEDNFEYTIEPAQLSIISTSNSNTLWAIVINPTYTGTVTWNSVTNSVVEYAENNNNTVTDDGIVLGRGSFSNNTDSLTQKIESVLKIGKDLLGNVDEMWLIVTAIGQAENYRGTINFKELI